MFSRWIVTNITSARGTLHCRNNRIPCGDQLVICGLYMIAAYQNEKSVKMGNSQEKEVGLQSRTLQLNPPQPVSFKRETFSIYPFIAPT
jgi:hypothetical protein